MSEPTVSERLRACHQYCVKTADEDGMTPEQVEFGTIYREAADLIDALVEALEPFVRYGHYESSAAYVVRVPDQHFHAATAALARSKGKR